MDLNSPYLFRELADNAPVMIWRAGLDKLCDFFNKPWLDFTGRTIDEELGVGWSDGVHGDDFDRCMKTYVEAFDAREAFTMEYRLRRHDGAFIWLLDNGKPFFRGDGVLAGYFGSCVDIDERKHVEASRDILVDELNHRVKNVLSTVQAIASQSLRRADNIATAYGIFSQRLSALSSAHDLLTTRKWQGVGMAELVGGTLNASGDVQNVHIEGPPVQLPPQIALSLATVLHELLRNAQLYGALSTPLGVVSVKWETSLQSRKQWLKLRWQESGGPRVSDPSVRGFGARLIEQMLARDVNGVVQLRFEPQGVACDIAFPLSS